ncbi:MAG: patatin-like phospholipase family protein [Actinobacteria bacterium]|nr:patatin-like phospholipase family protein [Actinomycetota bacterium]MCB9388704.1 patatin-like phospholipase family protein [Acidimicrobiia bacterium]
MHVFALPKPVGFVLSGGGSLGAYQVGMLRSLKAHGVVPDLIAGTSIGAWNGAVLAEDPDRAAERLSDVWLSVERHDLIPSGWRNRYRAYQADRSSMFPGDAVRGFLGRVLRTKAIEELAVPFCAVATSVERGRAVVLGSGPLEPALRASAAVPGVFSAVHLNGEDLYDGGLVANVPVWAAIDMGAKSLVVLDCARPSGILGPPTSIVDAVSFSVNVIFRRQTLTDVPAVSERVPVIYLQGPDRRGRVSAWDLDHVAESIGEAMASSAQTLDCLDIDGPGLYGDVLVSKQESSETSTSQQ